MTDTVAIPVPVKETKAFYLTSEFWIHNVLQLLLWVGALPTDGAAPWVTTVISAAAAGSYILSRGVAKSGTTPEATAVLAAEGTQTVSAGKAKGYDGTAVEEAEPGELTS